MELTCICQQQCSIEMRYFSRLTGQRAAGIGIEGLLGTQPNRKTLTWPQPQFPKSSFTQLISHVGIDRLCKLNA